MPIYPNTDFDICNMRKAKMHLSLLALVLLFGNLSAQYGLQSTLLRDHVWSQASQPANIVEGDFEKFRYGAQGSFWLGNTHAPLAGIFADSGYITEAVKDRLIGDLKPNENISGGYHLNLASVNLKFGEQRFGFYLDEYASIYARFNNPHTLGLVLKGNGAYAGDTVSDQNMSAKFLRTRELGIGTGWKWDKFSLGVRLRLKQGIKMADLSFLNYSLYTAPNGTQVHAQADYDVYLTKKLGKTKLFEFQGYGFGVDVGARYAFSDKFDVDVAANDVGFTSWATNNINDTVDVNWEGITIASLLQDSISAIVDQQVDSIKGLLLPDTTDARRMVYSPMQVRAAATFHFNEKASLSAQVVWYPLAVGAHSRLPLIGLTYQHEVVQGLTLGANAYGLGLDSYGVGALADYRFTIGSATFDVMAGSDNVLGWIAPTIGRGMNVFAGVGVGF